MGKSGTEITSTGKMSQVADNIERLKEQYMKSVDKMYQIGAEVDGMWDGEASQSFMSKFSADRTQFNALTTMLNRYIETLRTDIGIYVKAEADAKSVISTNKIR